jgi:hypothetical protein
MSLGDERRGPQLMSFHNASNGAGGMTLWVMNCRVYRRRSVAARLLIADTMVDCPRCRDGP